MPHLCHPAPVLFLCLAAACSSGKGGDSASPPLCAGLEVDLGEGEFTYAARADGDPVEMTHGPQGLWHVALAGAVRGTRGVLSVESSVIESNQGVSLAGELQPAETIEVVGWSADGCAGTFFGVLAILDDVQPGGDYQRFICTLNDNAAAVSARVTDVESGEVVEVGFQGILRNDPDDLAACTN